MLLTRLPYAAVSADGLSSHGYAPTIVSHACLDLPAWIAAVACLEIIGAVALSFPAFGAYAAPLDHGWDQLWVGLATFVVAWIVAAQFLDLYTKGVVLAGHGMLFRSLAAWALTFGMVLGLALGTNVIGIASRPWMVAWAMSVAVWVVGLRSVWQRSLSAVLRSGRCLDRALVLAGSAQTARRVGASIENESGFRIRVAAAAALPSLPEGPSFAWIEDAVRDGSVDRVVIADFEDAKDETNALLSRLVRLAVDVTLMPNVQGLYTPLVRVNHIGCIPAIDVASRPLSSVQALIKRIADLTIAGLILLLTLPLITLIGVAIKLDSPGPILFRQKRVGFHNSTFQVWKFRTMFHSMRDEGSVRQTSRDDRRVTRLGRILRQTSLDELPQFLNVLRGEMSVVGPRPHALNMTAAGVPLHEALEEYASRHRLKPGITGWAQVNGCRGEIDSEMKLRRRVDLDRYYIEHWSLALDAWIILRTISLVAFDRQAY